ncbi:MAG: cytoplasmic protein [Candidatus Omnitrophica bacterium]|nr:cytoplasmic protein [Candidatus Omnitrophota bacterium]
MEGGNHQYKDFIATRLYCPNCRMSMPVVEKLLLILPDGYLYDYICKGCGASLGDKKVSLSEVRIKR